MICNGTLRNMASVYLTHGDKLLLLYRRGSKVANNLWVGSAGGHFEPCEVRDARACVLRELREELFLTEEDVKDLKLKYITLRNVCGEIRQNYYFFAELRSPFPGKIISNEGDLGWFSHNELSALEMPFSAKFMLEHYLAHGKCGDAIYVGVAGESDMTFTQLHEG